MKGATLFSGIGAPECAMPSIDWRWCAEIDPFASVVHAARFPDVPNLGDVTEIDPDAIEPVDLVVFGSPCQSFSVAGKRLGLDDPRGNLALVALKLVGRIRPRWMVFENVPGLLSSDEGRDFGAFLGLLGECGYGFAYRILDAQHFGVPQRRRRVFVVGYLGDWRPAAAVLFEPESLRGDPAPRREAGERITGPVTACAGTERKHGHGWGQQEAEAGFVQPVAYALRSDAARSGEALTPSADAEGRIRLRDPGFNFLEDVAPTVDATGPHTVAHSLRADGFDASEDGTGRGTPLVTHALDAYSAGRATEDGTGRGTPLTLAIRGRGDSHDLEYRDDGIANAILTPNGGRAGIGVGAVAAFMENIRHELRVSDQTDSLKTGGGKPGQGYPAVMTAMTVRRLTPTECERLQGFPDDWTAVTYRGKPAADGPRYRALGNSMAVPVLRWLLERVRRVDAIVPVGRLAA